MHWHAPYNYWQWGFEAHTKAEGAHSLHAVGTPIWVGEKVSNPTKPGVATITPSAADVAWYTKTLDVSSPETKAIKDAYKEYLKAKASGLPAPTTPLVAVEEKDKPEDFEEGSPEWVVAQAQARQAYIDSLEEGSPEYVVAMAALA